MCSFTEAIYVNAGLDPAGPGYTDVPEKYRLDKGDAKLVDVIHTFMKVLSLAEPLGHVDFYPNGGKFQPGCPDIYDVCKGPLYKSFGLAG